MKLVDNKIAKQFIKDLKKLNKNINFETVKYRDSFIFVDNFNASKVNLPENWSYDVRLGFIYQDENDVYYIRTSIIELKQVNDIEDLAREMQRVNPTAQIGVDYYSSSEPKLTSNIGLANLNYPQGFYYNEKNGITNKHNTESGVYLNVDIMNDNQIDECSNRGYAA